MAASPAPLHCRSSSLPQGIGKYTFIRRTCLFAMGILLPDIIPGSSSSAVGLWSPHPAICEGNSTQSMLPAKKHPRLPLRSVFHPPKVHKTPPMTRITVLILARTQSRAFGSPALHLSRMWHIQAPRPFGILGWGAQNQGCSGSTGLGMPAGAMVGFARCFPSLPHLITEQSYCRGRVHRATKRMHNSYFPAHKRKDLCRSTCRLKTAAVRDEESRGHGHAWVARPFAN